MLSTETVYCVYVLLCVCVSDTMEKSGTHKAEAHSRSEIMDDGGVCAPATPVGGQSIMIMAMMVRAVRLIIW